MLRRTPTSSKGPPLPQARGPLSEALIASLGEAPGQLDGLLGGVGDPLSADPLADDDLHLFLYCAYELHYRSFAGIDPDWEWDPGLISARRELERAFLTALARELPDAGEVRPGDVGRLLFELAEGEADPSPSEYLKRGGTLEQFRELAVHRSAYQLKEADPHTWAIPRLHGPPKAAMVEVQADEYGSGRSDRMHSVLFARAMKALGLDSGYGAYLDRIPGVTLATVNLISALGLSRGRRGALVGHLAMFEITSPLPNSRYAQALRRLGFEGDALEFFDEHVEADSVHENIAAYDLAQGLARQDPELAAQIVFGARALLELEGRFAEHLLASWEAGRSSLRPAGDTVASPA